MTFETLLNLLSFPKVVEKELLRIKKELDKLSLDNIISDLTDINKARDANTLIKAKIGTGDNGQFSLVLHLEAALKVYDRYKENNISDKVYIETMKCFPRFVMDHYHRFNTYKFLEDWWTYRQTSMVLFRIGELEYEITNNAINLHIPTDANFTHENVINSLKAAKYFLNRHFPYTKDYKLTCESWLLSPELTEFLKPTSHIKAFQEMFKITDVNKDACGYKQWLFDTRTDAPISSLKEDNSLRKKVKQKLLNGGYIGVGIGEMNNKYW